MNSADSIGAAYRALAHRAWDTNRARAAELAGIVDGWGRSGALAAEEQHRGRAVAHSLRGSAGTFGHEQASLAADELEQILAGPCGSTLPTAVSELVQRIDEALGEEPDLGL